MRQSGDGEAPGPADLLRFPSGEGFEPLEHTYTPEQVTRFSEERLAAVTAAPGFEVERLAAKCPVPFRLLP